MNQKKILLFILTLFLFFSCKHTETNHLTIATAANMQFAMDKITEAFTNETGIKCETIISSSGKLTAQIKEGAPYHIFVSADMKYPNELYASGFATQKPKIYAYGKLVMWSMVDSIIPSIQLLQHKKIDHIAIANPKTAPYGLAAIEVLKKFSIFDSIQHKLVYGESIAQTNQFITTKAAEIGFTAKSVVSSPSIKEMGNWIEIDESNYTPIAQGIVILKNKTTNFNQAQKFYNFLFSTKGKEILKTFGYSVKE